MYHSINFEKKIGIDESGNDIFETRNTFRDWHLVSEVRPVIQPPGFEPIYGSIPGNDGSIDLSEVLSGGPLFRDISGVFNFIVLNDRVCAYRNDLFVSSLVNNGCLYPNIKHNFDNCHEQCPEYTKMDWTGLYDIIRNWIHGKRVKIWLEDDPEYYYQGRVDMASWVNDSQNSSITISYRLDPYKYSRTAQSTLSL